jgi:uncharacterized repeat protein (TIGR04052 family)
MKLKKILSIIPALLVVSCSNQQVNTPNTANTMPINIKFKAMADNTEIECGKEYSNIGTTKSKIKFTDFRMYISNVKLIDSKGKEVDLKLEQDKKWQNGNLSLLDFENKEGDCSTGTAETHKEITGTINKDTYKGLKFTLGVPFEQNHQDVNKAESPLNLTSMFWVWNSGYKFARIDMKTTGIQQGYFIHLGSTGCMDMPMSVKHEGAEDEHTSGSSPTSANMPPKSCMNPNRAEIVLSEFNPESNKVIIDVSKLLENSNVDTNQDKTPSGCMSSPDDKDCEPILNNLGIKFNASESKGQTTFRME